MARRLNADPAFARINQLIRLPGFVNGKHGNETELLPASNLSKTFDVEVLTKGFDLELIEGIHQHIPSMRRESPPRDSTELKEQIEDIRSALPYLATQRHLFPSVEARNLLVAEEATVCSEKEGRLAEVQLL